MRILTPLQHRGSTGIGRGARGRGEGDAGCRRGGTGEIGRGTQDMGGERVWLTSFRFLRATQTFPDLILCQESKVYSRERRCDCLKLPTHFALSRFMILNAKQWINCYM